MPTFTLGEGQVCLPFDESLESCFSLQNLTVGKKLEELETNSNDLGMPVWQEACRVDSSQSILESSTRRQSKQIFFNSQRSQSKQLLFDAQQSQQSQKSEGNNIALSLNRARRQANLRQMRIRIPAISLGIFFILLGLYFSVQDQGSPSELFSAYVGSPGVYFGFLAFLPSDRRALPLSAALLFLPITALYSLFECSDVIEMTNGLRSTDCIHREEVAPCWFVGHLVIMEGCQFTASCVMVLKIICVLIQRRPSPLMLDFFFVGYGWMFLCIGTFGVLQAPAGFVAGQAAFSWYQFVGSPPFVVLGVVMVFAKKFRTQVQSWFMSRGEAAVTAAGIAQLLGERSITQVLNLARQNFSCVRADRVTYQDIADNQPNPGLNVHTEKARLGFVDVFFSHSWHDDPKSKWEALQEFRKEFKEAHGREPTLWIDKYCINQDSIDDSLAALPVYLSGCKKLLIACGETYLGRLWCLIEIFVFLEMGGQRSNLDVRLLRQVQEEIGISQDSHDDTFSAKTSHKLSAICKSESSALNLHNYITDFNPEKAVCFTEYDTQRLHAVIEITGYDKILALVHEVFVLRKE